MEEISKAADKMQRAIVLKRPTCIRSCREVNKANVADIPMQLLDWLRDMNHFRRIRPDLNGLIFMQTPAG